MRLSIRLLGFEGKLLMVVDVDWDDAEKKTA